ncbi:hypothetical protein JCM16814_13670 [Desulfobaculum senezii]|jgi:hypothetical protein
MKRLLPILLTAGVLLGGCSLGGVSPLINTTRADALPYNELALRNLALGRDYQGQGRFELARETFLQGLAAAQREDMRAALTEEIETTDRLIRTRR